MSGHNGLSPAEQLAQPTPADIELRLQNDARSLAARLDGYCGPVGGQLTHELEMLASAVEALLTGE